jgi:hypothetical protein
MLTILKRFVRAVSVDESNFLAFLTAILLISIPITVFAVLQSRDPRPRATHQDCFDLNGDFKVTQADGQLILDHTALGRGYYAPYDIDHNRVVTAVDAVLVLGHKDEICSPKITFSASPTTINVGGTSKLNWNVKYANSVYINSGIGTVGLSGSKRVSPISTTTYTLRAVNNWAAHGQKSVKITVNPVAGFTPTPQPDGTVTLTPNILKKLKLKISAPYLVGKVKIPLLIGGRSKKIEISGGTRTYDFGVSKDKFKLGKKLTVVIGGDNTLKKKFQITPKKEVTTVKVGVIYFGNLTKDSKINNTDQNILLDSISKQTLVGDLNADGITNSLDWAILLVNFGKKGS